MLSYSHSSDVMTLSELKQQVYVALDPQESVGKEIEMVEAQLNVMQAVFLAIQSSPFLDVDILEKGQLVFQILINRHFTETLEVYLRDAWPVVCVLVVHDVLVEVSNILITVPCFKSDDFHPPAKRLLSLPVRSDICDSGGSLRGNLLEHP